MCQDASANDGPNAMTAPALAAGSVQVYALALDDVDSPAARRRCESVLSPAERAQRNLFVFERNRREYLFAHGLVRLALSRHAPSVPPEAWEITPTTHGRPEVTGPPSAPLLRFNLSHTDGLVACVVAAAQDVGVDVEALDRPGATLELAEHYFAAPEIGALRAMSGEAQRVRFYQYWALKESYIKARGLGLALPLDRFHFQIDSDAIRIALAPELDDRSERWCFSLEHIGARHLLAVAAGHVTDAPLPVIAAAQDGRALV